MKLAYLTTDEVNAALAVEMGYECGVTVQLLDPRDGTPDDSQRYGHLRPEGAL